MIAFACKMNQHELGDGRTIGLEKTGVPVNQQWRLKDLHHSNVANSGHRPDRHHAS